MIPLRPYQEQGLAAVEAFVAGGGTRPLLAHATGLGKTILFGSWIAHRGGRALVIAHRDELINQAAEKIVLVAPDLDIGIVKAERNDTRSEVVIASIQTLARSPERLAEICADGLESVVIDECHHAEAESYQKAIRLISCATKAPILGVTATPARGDHKLLGHTWQEIVHSVSILDGIRQGYLCDLRAERVRLDLDLQGIRMRAGDYDEGQLEYRLLNADVPVKVAEAVKLRAADRKTLVFTPGVQSAYDTAGFLRERGIQAAALHGEVSLTDRHRLLRNFHEGKVQCLVNCNVLCEGFDEATITCVTIARPTKSQPFYSQMLGRGTRTSPGKQDCLILDCVDAAFAHDLVTLAELFRYEAGDDFARRLSAGAGVAEALEAVDAGELKIEPVPLSLRKAFAWVKAGAVWCLSLGSGTWLQLIEVGSSWHVEEAGRDGVKGEPLWKGPSLEYAQGVAEDVMRARGAEALVDLDAGWRRAPLSDGQAKALDRWGVPYDRKMRRGDASDLLMKLIAGKAAAKRRSA